MRESVTDIFTPSMAARELGRILETDPNPAHRLMAVENLGKYRGQWDIFQALLPGLCDPDPVVYQATVLALSRT